MKTIFTLALMFFLVSCSSSKKSSDSGDAGSLGAEIDRLAEAEDELGEAKSSSSTKNDRYKRLRESLKTKKTKLVVRSSAEVLSGKNEDLKALNALAMHYFDKGRYGMAKTILDRAFKKYPNESSLYNNLGLILLAEGERTSAIKAFNKALTLNGSSVSAAYNLGNLYSRYRQYDKALPYLRIAFRKESKDTKLANNYAVALRGVGRFKEAEAIYKKQLSRSQDAGVLYNYAVLLVKNLNEPKKGLDLLGKLRKMKPKKKLLANAERLEKTARTMVK